MSFLEQRFTNNPVFCLKSQTVVFGQDISSLNIDIDNKKNRQNNPLIYRKANASRKCKAFSQVYKPKICQHNSFWVPK